MLWTRGLCLLTLRIWLYSSYGAEWDHFKKMLAWSGLVCCLSRYMHLCLCAFVFVVASSNADSLI